MKRFFLSALFFIAAFMFVTTFLTSCSSNSGDIEAPVDASIYIGSWVCTSSTDVNEKTGHSSSNLLKDQSIVINSNGTYTSSSANFGYKGTYTLVGNTLTVITNTGQTIILSISYRSGIMIWEGSVNGYRIHYEFSKSGEGDTPVDPSVYMGTWKCTLSTDINENTGESISNHFKGETITIKSDGTYTSSSSNFGKTGKYVLNGSNLTVTTNNGQSITITISYRSGAMIWDGSANGYRFHYEFSKIN